MTDIEKWEEGIPACKECGKPMQLQATAAIADRPDLRALRFRCENGHSRIFEERKTPAKRAVLSLVGGPWDGVSPESQMAEAWLFLTDNGTVGKAFMTASPAGIQRMLEPNRPKQLSAEGHRYHKYEIVSHDERNEGIFVTAKYIGPV